MNIGLLVVVLIVYSMLLYALLYVIFRQTKLINNQKSILTILDKINNILRHNRY